jgi:hypothetical protein
MSLNNVQRIDSVERVRSTSSSLMAPDKSSPPAELEKSSAGRSSFSTENEAPLRFPWLSWQTRALDMASKQPSPYGSIPLLGKELDRKA